MEGEKCGGPFGVFRTCDEGLKCIKHIKPGENPFNVVGVCGKTYKLIFGIGFGIKNKYIKKMNLIARYCFSRSLVENNYNGPYCDNILREYCYIRLE